MRKLLCPPLAYDVAWIFMIFANVFLSSSEAEAEARRGPHTNKNVSNFHGLIHCHKSERLTDPTVTVMIVCPCVPKLLENLLISAFKRFTNLLDFHSDKTFTFSIFVNFESSQFSCWLTNRFEIFRAIFTKVKCKYRNFLPIRFFLKIKF